MRKPFHIVPLPHRVVDSQISLCVLYMPPESPAKTGCDLPVTTPPRKRAAAADPSLGHSFSSHDV